LTEDLLVLMRENPLLLGSRVQKLDDREGVTCQEGRASPQDMKGHGGTLPPNLLAGSIVQQV